GLRQLVDLHELGAFHPLHDELCDPVTPGKCDRLGRIVVDQADPDLAAVTRVDGAWRVDDGQADPRGQTGPRMDETGVAGRQRDRDAGPHNHALARREHGVAGGHEIGAGIAGTRVAGHRDARVEPGEQDLHSAHGRRDYPGPVGESAGAAVNETAIRHSERLYVPWWNWPLPLIGAGLIAATIH